MAAKVTFLADTCIFIDYLRGEAGVYDFLANDKDVDLAMSAVTMMELMIGAFNKREVQRIQKAFKKIKTVNINEDISRTAQYLVQTYTKSHNLQIADALIEQHYT
ncbi:MAG: type II toxin-antitoxin system VapC family toxin [Treponemataceae bacterium]|nr:MAG: type II toxin-antitoxin system VapC family toxin [Treponemataceae bacterium]